MKTAYEAANTIEAHMLCHLLKQEHIAAQVLGEHLQGAIGELPAAGLVRVVVDEDDWARARSVIAQWEADQPAMPTASNTPMARSGGRLVVAGLLGLVIGTAATTTYFRVASLDDGIDHNHDGVLDERWHRAPSGLITHIEFDRNLDGRVDEVIRFDARGMPLERESDADFDGRFDTRLLYDRRGEVRARESLR